MRVDVLAHMCALVDTPTCDSISVSFKLPLISTHKLLAICKETDRQSEGGSIKRGGGGEEATRGEKNMSQVKQYENAKVEM